MRQILITILLAAVVAGAFLPVVVGAQQIVPADCDRVNRDPGSDNYGKIESPCRPEHVIELFVTVANWVLGVMGAFALAFFVYGGFLWITSAGNTEKVGEGRKVLANTVIAIIIILAAFALIRFVGNIFDVQKTGEQGFDTYLEGGNSN